ncbi:1302_t:CDS:2 [Cetraspora pellucida]|uniref:1302_t:CDS:1 n=1 Tax=Cetraspora pellucida TaxID=1433469 RepID=A0ACA9LVW5_9GLOM|nr:1302_t:CDS:2 [Cetraspora pellucida]
MPKQNPYLENKKPIELVQELKDEYKMPSYEEFMKGYGSDGNLNYDDLNEDYHRNYERHISKEEEIKRLLRGDVRGLELAIRDGKPTVSW